MNSVILDAMRQALDAAQDSPDPSTQNGAVILGQPQTADCNRFPTGVQDNEERWERPLKYTYVEHAERNAIFAAARHGIPTAGSTLVCPWAACSDCARAIVSAGITTLIRFPRTAATGAHWHESCRHGDIILVEGGVEIIEPDFSTTRFQVELRRDGKLWRG